METASRDFIGFQSLHNKIQAVKTVDSWWFNLIYQESGDQWREIRGKLYSACSRQWFACVALVTVTLTDEETTGQFRQPSNSTASESYRKAFTVTVTGCSTTNTSPSTPRDFLPSLDFQLWVYFWTCNQKFTDVQRLQLIIVSLHYISGETWTPTKLNFRVSLFMSRDFSLKVAPSFPWCPALGNLGEKKRLWI